MRTRAIWLPQNRKGESLFRQKLALGRTSLAAALLMTAAFAAEAELPKDNTSNTSLTADTKARLPDRTSTTPSLAANDAGAKLAEFRKRIQDEFSEIEPRIEELKTSVSRAGREAKTGLDRELKELESKRLEVRQRLQNLKRPSREAWDDIKSGMQKSFDDLKNAYEKAKSHFEKNP